MTQIAAQPEGKTRDTYWPGQEVEPGYLSHLDSIVGVSAPNSKDTWDPRLLDRLNETRVDPRKQLNITQRGAVTIAEYAAQLPPDIHSNPNPIFQIRLRQSPMVAQDRLTEAIEVPHSGWPNWYLMNNRGGVTVLTKVEVVTETIVNITSPSTNVGAGDTLRDESKETEEWNSARVTDSLLSRDAEKDRVGLQELVLRAEDTAFTPEQSARVAPRLLDLALRYRKSDSAQDEPMVWSAIRTGASMLHPDQTNLLLPLLEPGHPIETSLVALKMLGRIFEAQPPDAVDVFVDLAEKVREIADSLLKRYPIAISRPATMAQLAIYALAAMGSTDTLEVVRTVRGLEVAWFTRRMEHKLRELGEYWDNRLTAVASAPRELLDRVLIALCV